MGRQASTRTSRDKLWVSRQIAAQIRLSHETDFWPHITTASFASVISCTIQALVNHGRQQMASKAFHDESLYAGRLTSVKSSACYFHEELLFGLRSPV